MLLKLLESDFQLKLQQAFSYFYGLQLKNHSYWNITSHRLVNDVVDRQLVPSVSLFYSLLGAWSIQRSDEKLDKEAWSSRAFWRWTVKSVWIWKRTGKGLLSTPFFLCLPSLIAHRNTSFLFTCIALSHTFVVKYLATFHFDILFLYLYFICILLLSLPQTVFCWTFAVRKMSSVSQKPWQNRLT